MVVHGQPLIGLMLRTVGVHGKLHADMPELQPARRSRGQEPKISNKIYAYSYIIVNVLHTYNFLHILRPRILLAGISLHFFFFPEGHMYVNESCSAVLGTGKVHLAVVGQK